MATSLDRLPHRNLDDGCRAMISNFPEATPVPCLTRSFRIWTENTPCLKVNMEKRELFFDLNGGENELAEFYDKYLSQDLDYFAVSPELDPALYRLAEMYKEEPWPGLKFVEFHVPGIYSWGHGLKDDKGAPAFYNNTLRDVMVKMLTMKAKWRERKIKELFPGVKTLVTLGNGGLGLFMSPGGTGTWDEIKNLYNEQIESLEGITFIHCCSNFDWSLLMETKTDGINFDAYQYGNTMSLYPAALDKFLKRGGMIAWGIVPTTGSGGDITTESPVDLADRLEGHIQSVVASGIDKQALLESSWVMPTCEATIMTVEQADLVLEYTREVSQLMRKRYFA